MGGGIVKKLWRFGTKSFLSSKEADEEYSGVRKGYVRLYVVGKDLCKLEIEANYLNHPLFENLLRLSKEKFGYSYTGALRIACELDLFLHLLHLLNSSNPTTAAHYMQRYI
ncbi:hypothetical protein HS088_TW12G00467 [Tripterygium wilfordii]|uniref:Uncharacterized protein n=1 Tax=Tripterygium wilfordii TaxID=458696 RepID=A0A7J7CYT2_TRIWF|nr:hypothetical protein HS088_TW12G00467 [Tripterygium wilfordii]